jgi:hypothetical protein
MNLSIRRIIMGQRRAAGAAGLVSGGHGVSQGLGWGGADGAARMGRRGWGGADGAALEPLLEAGAALLERGANRLNGGLGGGRGAGRGAGRGKVGAADWARGMGAAGGEGGGGGWVLFNDFAITAQEERDVLHFHK